MDVCVVGLIYFECEIPSISEPLEIGTERFVERIPLGLGGALNPASVLARLGAEVHLVFPAGDGPSDAAARWAVERLPLRASAFAAKDDPAITVVQRGPTDRTFLSAADFAALEACPSLPAARFVHVPGLYEAQRLLPRLVEARSRGAEISVSASWAPEAFAWLASLEDTPFDLLLLNEKEAEALAGEPARAPEVLGGAARDVVVTLGKDGAMGRLGGEAVAVEAEPVSGEPVSGEPVSGEPVSGALDFTGAGDAFAAGLLFARSRGQAPAPALRFASRVAARMLTVRGGVAFADDLFAGDLFAADTFLNDTTSEDTTSGLEETP